MSKRPDPTPAADGDAKTLARALMQIQHAALAYSDTAGAPGISRIALGLDPSGCPFTLISSLSAHFVALTTNPVCALMLGEPGAKGDPLTHPRLMIRARADFVDRKGQDHPSLRKHWLANHPKSKLYIDFADFCFVRLHPLSALLNAGFGKASTLTPDDLLPLRPSPL